MAALCGLPPPSSYGQRVNGTNLAPMFDQLPTPGSESRLKQQAFSQFGKGANYGEKYDNFTLENRFRRDQTFLMGYTVRTDSWRYTCWFGVRKLPTGTTSVPCSCAHHIR